MDLVLRRLDGELRVRSRGPFARPLIAVGHRPGASLIKVAFAQRANVPALRSAAVTATRPPSRPTPSLGRPGRSLRAGDRNPRRQRERNPFDRASEDSRTQDNEVRRTLTGGTTDGHVRRFAPDRFRWIARETLRGPASVPSASVGRFIRASIDRNLGSCRIESKAVS